MPNFSWAELNANELKQKTSQFTLSSAHEKFGVWTRSKDVLPGKVLKYLHLLLHVDQGKTFSDNKSIASNLINILLLLGKSLLVLYVFFLKTDIIDSVIGSTANSTFQFNSVSSAFVLEHLGSLKTNKAIGLNKISARLLNDFAEITATVLTGLINKSFHISFHICFFHNDY